MSAFNLPPGVSLNDEHINPREQFICKDVSGSPLSFLGNGHAIQVEIEQSDRFDSMEDAETALKNANEKNGFIEQL